MSTEHATPAVPSASDPRLLEQVTMTDADAAALLAAVRAVLSGDATGHAQAVYVLARAPHDAQSGAMFAPEYLLGALWASAACRQVLDHCFADSWREPDSIGELLGLITPGMPAWACRPQDLGALLLALRAGASGQLPGEVGVSPGLEDLLRAGIVLLAWASAARGVDLAPLFAAP